MKLIVFTWLASAKKLDPALLVPAEFVEACKANGSVCERHNYHEFDLPPDYNKNHSPGGIVKVQLGMYYNQLLYLDTASESFGLGVLDSNVCLPSMFQTRAKYKLQLTHEVDR